MAKQPSNRRAVNRRMAAVEPTNRDLPEHAQVTLSNGIVLRGRKVNNSLLMRVASQYPTPDPPVDRVEDADGSVIEEPRLDDKDYLDQLERVYEDRLNATNRVMWATGTEFISSPDGVFGPDDDEWINEVEQYGVEPDVTTPQRRYHDWLTMYALATDEDQTWASAIALAETGTLEAGVREALDFFRRKAGGGEDPPVPAE